jgi:GntR family transcriptional regulator / MocR family aminotransferase
VPKIASSFELTLHNRKPQETLTSWLYGELRGAILERRLAAGTRLPASRNFALRYRIPRGTVVSVFERLQADGYLSCRVGSGTRVNHVAAVDTVRITRQTPRVYARRVISGYAQPKPFIDWVTFWFRAPCPEGISGW